MKMYKSLLVFSTATIVFMFVAMLILGDKVPVHFNAKFEIDAMGAPWLMLFISIIPVLCTISIWFEKKWNAMNNKQSKTLTIILYVVDMIFVYITWLMFWLSASKLALGETLSISYSIFVGLPITLGFFACSHCLSKLVQNAKFGYRNKATCSDAELWAKTHNLSGLLCFISAFVVAVGSVLAYLVHVEWIMLIIVAVCIATVWATPYIYANCLNKQKNKE